MQSFDVTAGGVKITMDFKRLDRRNFETARFWDETPCKLLEIYQRFGRT